MKLLVFCAFVVVVGVKMVDALAAAKIGQNAQDIQLLRYDSTNDGLGTYSFAYAQSDSSRRNEEGELKNAGAENEYIAVRGYYSWGGPDGVTYTMVDALADAKIDRNAQDIQLLRYNSTNDGLRTYSFAYEQSDNSRRNEEGELKNAGAENEYIAVRGYYSWDGPDGVTYTVSYIADEKGYQPTFEMGTSHGLSPVLVQLLG